jgi:hypothetical protein
MVLASSTLAMRSDGPSSPAPAAASRATTCLVHAQLDDLECNPAPDRLGLLGDINHTAASPIFQSLCVRSSSPRRRQRSSARSSLTSRRVDPRGASLGVGGRAVLPCAGEVLDRQQAPLGTWRVRRRSVGRRPERGFPLAAVLASYRGRMHPYTGLRHFGVKKYVKNSTYFLPGLALYPKES